MTHKCQSSLRPRGFTLIELMTVVAIIGLLASMAMPSFKGFLARAKRTERTEMLAAINKSLQAEYNANDGQWENSWGGGTSYSQGNWNPSLWPWVSGKKQFLTGQPGWTRLAFVPEGSLYYSYYYFAYSWTGGTPYYITWAQGDVDGDGIINNHEEYWLLDNTGSWYQYWAVPYPSPSNAPWEWCSDGSQTCD